jgi:hypothetical protein
VAWFVVDCAGSWVSGLHGNIVLNAVSLALLAPPLGVLSTSEWRVERADLIS